MPPFSPDHPHAIYYRLAQNRGDGIYAWASVVYNDVLPLVIHARLRQSAEGYVFASTLVTKLELFLDRFNEGMPSVCLSIRDLLAGVQFHVVSMEKEIEENKEPPPPPTLEEEMAFTNRLLFVKWLMLERGLFDEWLGEEQDSSQPIYPLVMNSDQT